MNKKIKVVSGEAENLQLHVELCAERYNRMEEKFSGLENRLEYLQRDFSDFKDKADSNFNDLKYPLLICRHHHHQHQYHHHHHQIMIKIFWQSKHKLNPSWPKCPFSK